MSLEDNILLLLLQHIFRIKYLATPAHTTPVLQEPPFLPLPSVPAPLQTTDHGMPREFSCWKLGYHTGSTLDHLNSSSPGMRRTFSFGLPEMEILCRALNGAEQREERGRAAGNVCLSAVPASAYIVVQHAQTYGPAFGCICFGFPS